METFGQTQCGVGEAVNLLKYFAWFDLLGGRAGLPSRAGITAGVREPRKHGWTSQPWHPENRMKDDRKAVGPTLHE